MPDLWIHKEYTVNLQILDTMFPHLFQDSLAAVNMRQTHNGRDPNNKRYSLSQYKKSIIHPLIYLDYLDCTKILCSNMLSDQTIQRPGQATSKLAMVESNDSQPADIIRATMNDAARKRKDILQQKRY